MTKRQRADGQKTPGGPPIDWAARPHGTATRARWHYRQGHKPLERFCPSCAAASRLDSSERKLGKKKPTPGVLPDDAIDTERGVGLEDLDRGVGLGTGDAIDCELLELDAVEVATLDH